METPVDKSLERGIDPKVEYMLSEMNTLRKMME